MKAEEIFLAALEKKTPAERQAYLQCACGDNADLRAEVAGLLQAHESAGSFLNAPLFDSPTTTNTAASQLDMVGDFPLDFLATTDSPDALGRIGPYEVTERIGRGGMGLVLKAHDAKLNRVVAIKVMAPELAVSPTARKRFVREAQAAAAVVHQHVVTIHAVDEDRLPYLVMEYINGQSLQQKIDREGHLELKEILRIGQQIAAGLAAAHAHGLMHRDVKPANILLENGVERVRITDFGLARAVDDVGVTRTGEVAGTPQYMSPEQAQGLPMDARSDLFSLGCVLYAMCTGRSPFRAETTLATVRRVCDDTPRPIREVNPEIPQWLALITARLLAKQPAERFQAAAEVAELLGRHLAEVQHPSTVGNALEGVPRTARHAAEGVPYRISHRWAIAATVLLCLIVGLGLSEAGGVTKLTTSVIRVLTPQGTLIIEVDDPAVSVTVEGDGGLVITGAGPREVRLPAGDYKVRATKDGQPVKEEMVSISRGGKQTVRVSREPFAAAPIARGVGQPLAPRAVLKGHANPQPASAPFDAATAKDHQESWASHLGVPMEFSNSLGMKFRLIPPGEFMMGSTPQAIEAARAADKYSDDQGLSDALTSEGPIHKVVLSEPFYLGVTEVTQQEFVTVTGRNPSSFRPGGTSADQVKDAATSQLPVQGTSWNDAADFCSRLSVLEGLSSNYRLVGSAVEMLPGNGYRLPREAQWEFACRAGTTTAFWFGDQPTDHQDREWLRTNAAGRPHPVAALAENPFGLFDMHGNVSEWCQDGWNPEFYLLSSKRPAVDPLSKPAGPHQHMVRGGAWTSAAAVRARSAFRMPAVPSKEYEPNGFRVALSVDSARLVIERQRSNATTAPLPPMPRAFAVLGGAGVAERRFDTLAEAVQRASAGDTIEIRGNGPFVTPGVTIGQRLVIRAGPDHTPTLTLSQAAADENIPLITTSASLVLEGLELRRTGGAEGEFEGRQPILLKTWRQGEFSISNCRFIWNSLGNAWCGVIGAGSPVLRVRNCQFIGADATAAVSWNCPPGGRGTIENCVSCACDLLSLNRWGTDVTGVSVQLRRNTTVGEFLVLGFDQARKPAGEPPVRLDLSENVTSCTNSGNHAILRFDQSNLERSLTATDAEVLLRAQVALHEQRNVYAAGTRMLHHGLISQSNFSYLAASQGKNLTDWNRFWTQTDTGSLEGNVHFQGGDVLQRALTNPQELAPADFRLREDSVGFGAGPDGKDLGADVNLVGPGQAYERWKKTPEYQEWLKETGQLKERASPKAETGAFVLLAAGKERKFGTLADAVRAATDGDTIEIRGNGPFVSDGLTILQRLLIRAGEGYAPTIMLSQTAADKNIPLLATSAPLVLEGLELRRIGGAKGEFEGRFPTLLNAWGAREEALHAINCRFAFNTKGGGSGELIASNYRVCNLRNCQFNTDAFATLGWYFPRGGRGTIENCVNAVGILALNLRGSEIPDAVVQVRRNTTAGRCLVLGFDQALKPTGEAPIRLDFSENVTHCRPGFDETPILRLDHVELKPSLAAGDAETMLRALFALHEQSNVYLTGSRMLHHSIFEKGVGRTVLEASQGKDLAGWNRFWKQSDTGSVEGDVRFQGGDLFHKALNAPETLTAEDFRLREDSAGYRAGPDGKDLGADVDLVGPGAAYERWKQTPEYEQWRTQIGATR